MILFVSCSSRWGWRRGQRTNRLRCLMGVIGRVTSTLESAKSSFNSLPLTVEEEVEIVGESSDR